MKTVVAVVVYNRIKNVQRWLDVWDKAKPRDAELRIIHNVHPNEHVDNIRGACEAAGVTYIPRVNIGMDIGAFQDVCRRRLKGFLHDFEFLLWITDDTFPMRYSFVDEFVAPFSDPKTGLTCYEISPQIKKHVRTTGFCIRASMLGRITFDVDPIRTKDDCWAFEHRSNKNLYLQILAHGLDARQLAHIPAAPVWDSGGGGIKWPDREEEFLLYWKFDLPPGKVLVIAPAFNSYPEIVSSMICQTYKNWELHLIHDGPAPHDYPKFKDERILFCEMPRRRKEYGHPIRMDWLQKVKAKEVEGKYVVVTNQDNHHVPHFLEKLVHPLEENKNLIGSYCSMIVHNYAGTGRETAAQLPPGDAHHVNDGYGVIETKPQQGFIDCAAAMVRAEIAGAAGWPSTRHSSDFDYLNTIANRNGGWEKFARVFGALLTHN